MQRNLLYKYCIHDKLKFTQFSLFIQCNNDLLLYVIEDIKYAHQLIALNK